MKCSTIILYLPSPLIQYHIGMSSVGKYDTFIVLRFHTLNYHTLGEALMLASKVGNACFKSVTVLLHLLNVNAMDSTSTKLILFFLLITPLRVSSTLASN